MLSACPYSVTVVTGCQCVLFSCVCGYSGDISHGSFLRCDTVFLGVVPDVSEDRNDFVVSVSPKAFETSGTIRSETCIFHARNRSGRVQLARVKEQTVYGVLGSGCDWFREQSMYSANRN
jgi:hypothetical protein